MFNGRSSGEPRGERAHRGAGDATAPVDPTWSDRPRGLRAGRQRRSRATGRKIGPKLFG